MKYLGCGVHNVISINLPSASNNREQIVSAYSPTWEDSVEFHLLLSWACGSHHPQPGECFHESTDLAMPERGQSLSLP